MGGRAAFPAAPDSTEAQRHSGVRVVSGEDRTDARSFYALHGKRALDLTLGLMLFVLALPLMCIVALAVLVTSGRPVLYGSERIGRDGRRFTMWKFRSMVRDADAVMERWQQTHPLLAKQYAKNYKLKHDPRITSLGNFLRKSSLDELPQFWSVLRGDMTLVGPRPYLPTLAPSPQTADAILALRPAITGPFQVNGRNTMTPQLRMALDAMYASNVTLRGDLSYLLRTVRPLLRWDGD